MYSIWWLEGTGVITLPETNIDNIAPENGWLEDYFHLLSFWNGLFSGAMLVVGSVNGTHFEGIKLDAKNVR